jgi:MFS family permease
MTDTEPLDNVPSAPSSERPEGQAYPTRRGAFALLFACLVTSGIGNSMLFAILPPLVREIGMADVTVGAVYTVSAVAFTFASQFWGSVSDVIGRRPVILVGLMGYALSMFAFAAAVAGALAGAVSLTMTFLALTLSRGAFGLIGSAAGPAAQAYIADRTPPEGRTAALSRMTSAFALGAAIGPAIAAGLAPITGYVAPLAIVAGAALFGAVAVHLFVPERRPPQLAVGQGGLAARAKLATDARLFPILSVGVAIWVVQGSVLQTINFHIMDALGVNARDALALAGIVLTLGALAGLIAQIGVVPFCRLLPRTAMVMGGLISAFGLLLLMVVGNLVTILIGFCATSFGMGLSRPGMTGAASLAVSPEEQGGAAGVAAGTAGAGFIIAPFTGLGLRELGGTAAPYLFLAVIALGSALLALVSKRVARANDRARSEG